MLAGADESMSDLAFQYGRNVGLAFQLVDDLLDFVSSAEAMGKPTAADLKLGLATAPVLFACEKVRSSILNIAMPRTFRIYRYYTTVACVCCVCTSTYYDYVRNIFFALYLFS